jgi:predicted transcriptional regulator
MLRALTRITVTGASVGLVAFALLATATWVEKACSAEVEAGAVIRDTSGRTVARIVREVGGGLAIRDTSGRTVARIKGSK